MKIYELLEAGTYGTTGTYGSSAAANPAATTPTSTSAAPGSTGSIDPGQAAIAMQQTQKNQREKDILKRITDINQLKAQPLALGTDPAQKAQQDKDLETELKGLNTELSSIRSQKAPLGNLPR